MRQSFYQSRPLPFPSRHRSDPPVGFCDERQHVVQSIIRLFRGSGYTLNERPDIVLVTGWREFIAGARRKIVFHTELFPPLKTRWAEAATSARRRPKGRLLLLR